MPDIALFYYFSAPEVPEDCYLAMKSTIGYRNMFLKSCGENKIHFEFPMFENYSYNSICNTAGVRKIIQLTGPQEKFIIFQTRLKGNETCSIIGYFKISRAYYQITNYFNNNGFVWGIESDEVRLIEKNAISVRRPNNRGYRGSWTSEQQFEELLSYCDRINTERNIAPDYKRETNRLIRLFQNQDKIDEWRQQCHLCRNNHCPIWTSFRRYKSQYSEKDMFDVIHYYYTSNLYSNNILKNIEKHYLDIGGE